MTTHLPEEHKQKISISLTGRHLSDEHKQRISESHIGEGNNFYGRHHSEETKQKLSILLKEYHKWKVTKNDNTRR